MAIKKGAYSDEDEDSYNYDIDASFLKVGNAQARESLNEIIKQDNESKWGLYFTVN